MPRCPFALWRPWAPAQRQASYTKTQIIFHTMVGNLVNGVVGTGATAHWRTAGLESTFIILIDGTVLQLIDSSLKADANSTANRRAISVETEDNGEPNTMLWTDGQVASILRLIRWSHQAHGIPLRMCPAHDQPGVGYHTWFGESPRTNPWLHRSAKTCPGTNRKRQWTTAIQPLIAGLTEAEPIDVQVGVSAAAQGMLIGGAQSTVGTVTPRPRDVPLPPQRQRTERRSTAQTQRRGRTNSQM